jgi:spectinomycin phosphotransferase
LRAVPQDVDAGALAEALRSHYGLDVTGLDYFPHGAGAFHWLAGAGRGRWFVTVDDLAGKPWLGPDAETTFDGLRACYRAAMELHAAGLEFVVAPLPSRRGEAAVRLDERHSLVVSPFVEGVAGRWGEPIPDREVAEVVALLSRLHDAPAIDGLPPRPLVIPGRAAFEQTMRELEDPWDAGRYGARLRATLREGASVVSTMLATFDLQAAARKDARPVVTHGEPHPGNLLRTRDGLALLDWDTVALDRPERDLWMLGASGGAGDTYLLAWALTDLASYTAVLRAPHREDADTERAMRAIESIIAGDEPAPYGRRPYRDQPRRSGTSS